MTTLMLKRHRYVLLAVIGLVLLGCSRMGPKKATTHKKKPAVAVKTHASASASASAEAPAAHGSATPEPHAVASTEPEGANRRFALPFAWENSDNEPLARTREFVRESIRDNQEYMKRGPKFFEAFAKSQRPRSTVVTCSDSRVQESAWDITPENDDFVVRNIGNQLANSEGSVEYGVEHLATPVLMIVGHTGCGAVKAAMSDKSGLSPAVRREVDKIVLPKELLGQSADAAWTQAVVANLNEQVRLGLTLFGRYVSEGRLTVVGAIYDFRNDLGKGAGKLNIVNVNGNSEPQRLGAFVAAITGDKKLSPQDAAIPSSPSIDTRNSAEEMARNIENLPGLQADKPAREH